MNDHSKSSSHSNPIWSEDVACQPTSPECTFVGVAEERNEAQSGLWNCNAENADEVVWFMHTDRFLGFHTYSFLTWIT